MFKKLATASTALFIAIGLGACGHNVDGTVTGKTHDDGYFYTTMVTYNCGKSLCTHPQQNWMPDTWKLKVDGKGCEVDSDTYGNYREGDHFKGHCDN